jgi:hypothetical protein
MTNKIERSTVIEHALGSLGLLLIGLIGWVVERQQSQARVDVILGRLILPCVSAIGWIVDRGPFPKQAQAESPVSAPSCRSTLTTHL